MHQEVRIIETARQTKRSTEKKLLSLANPIYFSNSNVNKRISLVFTGGALTDIADMGYITDVSYFSRWMDCKSERTRPLYSCDKCLHGFKKKIMKSIIYNAKVLERKLLLLMKHF